VRRACIDIGSNTTRLLVAECGAGGFDAVHQERAFTHLGRDQLADGAIPPAKLEEVATVVTGQFEAARNLGCEEVRAVATAALRRAPNRHQLATAVREACGLEVQILTGEEEARLAFIGAARCFPHMTHGELGVVDVGGGSSELVVGSVPDRIRWSKSFPLGSGDLARGYLHSDPPSSGELSAARDKVGSTIGELEIPRPAEAAAVGGSAASLARLAGRILDAAAFTRALEQLAAAPRHEVAQRFGLDIDRVRLLPAGLLILEAVSARFRAPLVVAGGGLREGVLMEAARG
jgi:exopolyphosphatase / guanosine-5'-triphosphate,3'-diphosphate pyrophosphatase